MAHIRHVETDYDRLLASGYDRSDARTHVRGIAERMLESWKAPE
jgi:hypothetical protein